jgi:hypothetical protein
MDTPQLSSHRIASMMDKWRMDAHSTDLDRAELMRHYNGGALIDDDYEAGRSSPRRANLLFGHKFLSTPATRLMSNFNQGIGLLSGTLKRNAQIPASRRQTVEQTVNRVINEVIRESNRLYWPYRAVCGDAVIWGSAFLYRDDPYDWVPKYGRIYHDWDAPADITDDKFADWGFVGELSCGQIFARLDRLKEVDDEDSYWDKEELREIAEKMISRHDPQNAWKWPTTNDQHLDPISTREQIQAQAWGATAMNSVLPVYWFFTKRFDEGNKRPIDMYCVPRFGETCVESNYRGTPKIKIKQGEKMAGVLFYKEEAFESISECLFPFVVSLQLGGKPMMRRVLGLGALNYDLDIKVQTNVHTGMEAAEFAGMPLFQETDSQSAQQLQDLNANSIRPFDVLPQGVGFFPKEKNAFPFKSSLEYVGLLDGKMQENSSASYGSGDSGPRGKDELEVAVLERQQVNAQVVSASMNDWLRAGDPMASTIGNVLCSGDLLEVDAAWPQQEAFRQKLQDEGIDWLEVEDQFVWKMRRPLGNGDNGIALTRARATAQVAATLGPAAQNIANRNLIAAINGDDMGLAMEMVPDAPPTSEQDQVAAAMGQNAIAITNGQPPAPRESDMVQIHVPIHFGALGRIAQSAIESGDQWTPKDKAGFEALAAHAMADIRRLGTNPAMQQQARTAQQQLMQLIGKASQFAVGTDVRPNVDPIQAKKLEQADAKLQQTERFKQIDLAKWQRTQNHREEMAAFQEGIQMGHLHETELNSKVARATKIAKAVGDARQQQLQPNGLAE